MSNYMPLTTRLMLVIVTTITLVIGVRTYLRTDSAAMLVEPNSPPVAVNDSYTVHGYISVSGPGIVANDFDPDGDPISLSSCSAVAHGTLNCDTRYRAFFYEPTFGYVETDSFTYQICDNLGAFTTTLKVS